MGTLLLVSLNLFFFCSLFLCSVGDGNAALENEILRNPKPSLVDRSVLSLNHPDISIDRRATGSDAALSESGATLRAQRHPRSHVEVPERDSELLSGALTRIRELEIEAERLEEAYRNHQQRATEDLTRHRTSSSTSYVKPRVTFTGPRDPHETLTRTPSGDQTPPTLNSPPARRLSSTPVSISRADAHHQTRPDVTHGITVTHTHDRSFIHKDVQTVLLL